LSVPSDGAQSKPLICRCHLKQIVALAKAAAALSSEDDLELAQGAYRPQASTNNPEPDDPLSEMSPIDSTRFLAQREQLAARFLNGKLY
jgi:hypothetical protein